MGYKTNPFQRFGLFIGKMVPFLGKFSTNIVTTITFVLVHSFTGYATDQTVFLVLQLLPLSLASCWLMQKTNSIWGSMLRWTFPLRLGYFQFCNDRLQRSMS